MKLTYVPLIALLFYSCKQNDTENNCFENGKEKNAFYKNFELDAPDKILKANPDHVQYSIDLDVKAYEDEVNDTRNTALDENAWKEKEKEHNKKYKDLSENFGRQFNYINIQKKDHIIYGIGENQFGYWFLEVKNNIPNAYFLGLSEFTHLNNLQPENFVSGHKISAYGSFIRIKKSWGYSFRAAT